VADEEAPTEAKRPRRNVLWLVGAAIVIAALGVAGLVAGVQDDPPTGPSGVSRTGGGAAAAIELPRLNGEGTVSLAAFRGRPVVVNFFASWCVPCRKEMPAFQEVSAQLQDRVTFVGVNHLDDRQGALRMVADTGVRYPTGYDPEGRIAASYGLFGMPTTLFVAPDGKLLETYTGEMSRDQLEKSISRLFGV
jgi:cytochrome c biogenesis protein CcmG, thiol:disulfide interchange protein DsbE